MVKLINKSKLHMVDGYIVDKKDRVVFINPNVISQINNLETELQQKIYLAAQPEAQPMPTLEGFERKSILDSKMSGIEPVETPTIDKRIEEAMAFAHEAEEISIANKVNAYVENNLKDLMEFVKSDKVIAAEGGKLYRIDTPCIGNILELTDDDILHIVMSFNDVCVSCQEKLIHGKE